MRAIREKHKLVKRTQCHCFHCGWDWTSSQEHPRVCPECHSAYWDRPVANRIPKVKKEGKNEKPGKPHITPHR